MTRKYYDIIIFDLAVLMNLGGTIAIYVSTLQKIECLKGVLALVLKTYPKSLNFLHKVKIPSNSFYTLNFL